MVSNSLYEQRAVEREKSTIHSEVLNVHKEHWNTIAETSHFVSFRNNVLGNPILGKVENISKITSQMVKNYHQTSYHGDNIKVVCAGGLDHQHIHSLCEEAFKTIKPTPPELKGYYPAPAAFTPGKMWINEPSQGDRAYAILNVEAPGFDSPDYIGFLLLNNVIYESDASASFLASLPPRMGFATVGSKINLLRNYAKYKSCYLPYKETGLFTLYLDCPIEDAGDAESLLLAFVDDLYLTVPSINQITQEEVERSFTKTINMMLQQDSTYELTQEIGTQLVYLGKKYSAHTWAGLVNQFATKEHLIFLVNKYLARKVILDNQPYTFTLWGDIGKHIPKGAGQGHSSYPKASFLAENKSSRT
jgi:predicted Zn-dependent peptidase